MDPISALSVIAAAARFVDWSRQIVCKSREIHDSIEGISKENLGSQTVTLRLKELTKTIQSSQEAANIHAANSRLQQICNNCSSISDELLKHLHRLKVPEDSEHRKWKSFRQAMKSVCSKKEIDGMASSLAVLRAELDTEVLVACSQNMEKLSLNAKDRFEKLDEDLQKIVTAVSNDTNSDQIRNSIEILTETQRAQFLDYGRISIVCNENFLALNSKSQEIINTLLDNQKVTVQHWGEHFQGLNRRIDSVSCEIHSNSQHTKATLDLHRDMRATLIQKDSEKRVNLVRLSLLESLRFDQMNDRPETIAKAHAKTFDWVFRDPSKKQKPWANFTSWLQHESGMYWVNGKPASGKSTLMKFIWGNQFTKDCLASWAGKARLLTGAFFFWNSGNTAQRSHDGLFRTLLYQVLCKSPEFLPKMFPEEWKRYSQFAACDLEIVKEEWTSPGKLKRAFELLVRLASTNLRLCFFIDGLDEAEGDSEDIAEFICEMSQASINVKFCVSSRLWPVFQTIFDEKPSLQLEDLTKSDIKLYVIDKLGTNKNIQKLLRHEPGKSQWLIDSIVNRASGVFLWVSLVVKSLISGIRDGDDTEALYHRLCSLPADLENLYEHIFMQIQQEYPIESSKIFQIFRASGNTLDIFTLFTALIFKDDLYERVLSLKLISKEQLSSKQYSKIMDGKLRDWTRRLNSRCRCLLEIAEDTKIDESPELIDSDYPTFLAGDFDAFGSDDMIQPEALIDSSFNPSNSTRERYSSRHPSTMDPSRPWRNFRRRPRTLNSSRSSNSTRRRYSRRRPNPTDAPRPSNSTLPRYSPKDEHFLDSDKYKVPIRYLHRTARDYVEQPHVWQKFLDKTESSVFDPATALLVSCLVGVKTSSTKILAVDQFTKYIVGLGLKASQTNINLLDELDRAVTARLMEATMPSKLSSADGGNTFLFSNKPGYLWHGDMLSCTLQKSLPWYAEAKGSSDGRSYYIGDQQGIPLAFASLQQRFVPILAAGFAFPEWKTWLCADGGKSFTNALPKSFSLVAVLLTSGCNPNQTEIFGRSIWEYVIHMVHVLGCVGDENVPFAQWVPIFELMLNHGADPHACCIKDSNIFIQGVGCYPGGSDQNRYCNIVEHTKKNYFSAFASIVRRGRAEDEWNINDSHAYFHSAEAVVRDVFVARGIPGATRLLDNLVEKKKSKEKVNREVDQYDDNNEGKPHHPHWV
ncbi:hypothetical protein GGI43DRAFT_414173, partial [Trichoderma evansii]